MSERRDEVGEEDFDEVVELFLEEVDEAIAALRDLTDLCKTCTAMPFFKRQRTEYRVSESSQICVRQARPPR